MQQVRALLNVCIAKSEAHLGFYKSLNCSLGGWQIANTLLSTTNLSFTAMATTNSVMLTPALISGGVHLVSAQILRGSGLRSRCQAQLKASHDYTNIAQEIRAFLRRQEIKLEPALPPPLGSSQNQNMNGGGMRQMNGGATPSSTIGTDIAIFLVDTRRTIALLEERCRSI